MKHKAKKISAVILSAVLAASSFSSIPAYAAVSYTHLRAHET